VYAWHYGRVFAALAYKTTNQQQRLYNPCAYTRPFSRAMFLILHKGASEWVSVTTVGPGPRTSHSLHSSMKAIKPLSITAHEFSCKLQVGLNHAAYSTVTMCFLYRHIAGDGGALAALLAAHILRYIRSYAPTSFNGFCFDVSRICVLLLFTVDTNLHTLTTE